MPHAPSIRLLTAADADPLIRVRRAALSESPVAFGTTLTEFEARGPAGQARWAADRLAVQEGGVWGAFLGDRLVGITGLKREEALKARHRGTIWGVYVSPEGRGLGLGRRMLEAAIAQARATPGLDWLQLAVVPGQVAAYQLYLSLGFIEWGREPASMNIDGQELEEAYLALDLRRSPTYQRHEAPRPDSDFEPGTLAHLVPGNQGRMLDPRRTPVAVRALDLDAGTFTLEVLAFEDRGAAWEMPFERVGDFQFDGQGDQARMEDVAVYQAAVERLDRTVFLAAQSAQRAETEAQIAALRADADAWLLRHSRFLQGGTRLDLRRPAGEPALWEDLEAYMAEAGLAEMEAAFAARFVSHPGAGEWVKGHRIVLAELGLVPYDGPIVRAESTFAGSWSRERRAEHIRRRMAFVQAMLGRAGYTALTVYRGMALDGPLKPPRNRGFVSSTCCEAIARQLYAPPVHAQLGGVLYRQQVPLERIFMTHAETRALNQCYQEAEAVLLFDPASLGI